MEPHAWAEDCLLVLGGLFLLGAANRDCSLDPKISLIRNRSLIQPSHHSLVGYFHDFTSH